MQYPSKIARQIAYNLNGVEYRQEDNRIPKDAKDLGIVVVYGASDDLMEFRGFINEEVPVYEGTVVPVNSDGLVYNSRFDCGCEFAAAAKKEILASSKPIEAIWGEGSYCWQYHTEIPHACFDVMMKDGEKYCRGIVFDIAALKGEQI
jgi:hypothetical protein